MYSALQQAILLGLKIVAMNSSNKEIENALTVENPDAAELLFKSYIHQFLVPFMHKALSVKEASDELKLPLNKVHYEINKLCDFGLLEITDTFIQKGRERKRYRANPAGYFIPFKITKNADMEEFFRMQDAQYYDYLMETFANYLINSPFNADTTGVHVGLDSEKDTIVKLSITDDPEQPNKRPFPPNVYAISDERFKLSFEDSVALQKEVKAVFAKYRKKQSGPAYIIRFFIAPWK